MSKSDQCLVDAGESAQISRVVAGKKAARSASLDLVRSLAIYSVVLIHVAQRFYCPGGEIIEGSVGFSLMIALGRLGVPLFLMLTGALCLGKRFDADGIARFYRNNYLSLLVTVELWVCLYGVYFFARGQGFDLHSLVRQMLFIDYVPFAHWWYIPMIVCLYMAIPFIGLAVQNIRLNLIMIPVAFVVVFQMLIPTYNDTWSTFLQTPSLPIPQLDLAPFGGVYCAYALLGFYCFKGGLRKIPLPLVVATSIGAYLLAVVSQYHGVTPWYSDPSLMVAALGIFEVMLRSGDTLESRLPHAAKRALSFASMGAFGIYLLHVIIIDVVAPHWLQVVGISSASTVLCSLLVLLASYAVVGVVRRSAVLARLLFDIRVRPTS